MFKAELLQIDPRECTHPLLFSQPERNLLFAILERAILDLKSKAKFEQNDIRSAKQFIRSDCDCPWSFIWICTQLDLDPYLIRRFIIEGELPAYWQCCNIRLIQSNDRAGQKSKISNHPTTH